MRGLALCLALSTCVCSDALEFLRLHKRRTGSLHSILQRTSAANRVRNALDWSMAAFAHVGSLYALQFEYSVEPDEQSGGIGIPLSPCPASRIGHWNL